MANIQNLSVSLRANTRHFTKGMRKAKFVLKDFSSGVGRTIGKVAGYGSALLTAAGVGGLGFMIQQQFRAVDAVAKTSDKLGIQIEQLTGLRFAAEQTGNSVESFDMGIQRMTRRIAEAAQGTGEAQDAIKTLGLDAGRLAAMSPDKQFMAIADAMENISSQGERVRLGFKLFDSEGVSLINTLRGGSEQIKEFLDQAEQLGVSVSRVEAKQIEQANDAINRMKNAITGAARRLAILLAPIVEYVAGRLTSMGTNGESTAQKISRGFEKATMWIAKLGDWVNFAKGIFQSFRFAVLKAFEYIIRAAERMFGFIGKGIELVSGKNPFDAMTAFADEAAKQAEDAFRSAGNNIGTGFNGALQKQLQDTIAEITKKSKENAQKAVGDLNQSIPKIGVGQDRELGKFEQIDSRRVAFGAQGNMKREQKVRVEQLDQTNQILREIKDNMGMGAVAA